MGQVSFLSDDEDNNTTGTDASGGKGSSASSQAAQPMTSIYDKSDSFELENCLNLLIETLLGLQPDQLAQLFLVYDC